MKALIAALAAVLAIGETRALAGPTSAAQPAGACAAPGSDGRACDDGLFCTVDDRCHAGVCIGEQRPCVAVVGFCEVATCDETRDACVPARREPSCVDRCDTTKLRKFYRKGWERGFLAVSRAWERRGESCGQAEAFIERAIQRFDAAQRAADADADQHAHRRCRRAGVLDGAYAAFEQLQGLCDQVCFLDGELVGTVAAKSYCELAIDSDGPLDVAAWVRGPLDVCGLQYETACDATFIGASIDYVNDGGACEPFTRGAYEPAWDSTRDRSCDYASRPD